MEHSTVEPPENRALLRRTLQQALLLRMVVATVIHLFVVDDVFAPDQRLYHAVSAQLAAFWAGDRLVLPQQILSPGPRGYFYLVAIQYFVFGAFALLPKLVNGLVGTFSIALIHDIAMRLTGSAAIALRSARYAAFFPSLVLWSVLNIRDAWVIMLITLVCREALVLQEKIRFGAAVRLAASLVAVMQFREYLLIPITLPLLLAFLARTRSHMLRNVIAGMLAISAAVYADRTANPERRLRSIAFEELQTVRYWNTVGAQSSFEQADISTPTRAIVFLPTGLALFLLAPFPWMLGSVRQVLAMPETLFFYSLLLPMVRGLRHLARYHLAKSLSIILVTAALTFGYALGEGNAGTAYRHRAQILCFYLFFAAVGVEVQRQRRETETVPPGDPVPSV